MKWLDWLFGRDIRMARLPVTSKRKNPVPTSASFNPPTLEVMIGDPPLTSVCTVKDQYGVVMPNVTVAFRSTDPAVVSVRAVNKNTVEATALTEGSCEAIPSVNGVDLP